MVCKYCHEKSHYIDTCPVIICKICGDVGHPKWLCPKLSSGSNNGLKKSNSFSNNNPSPSSNSSVKTYSSSLSISSPSNSQLNSSRNLNYYIKMIDEPWTKFY